MEPDKKTKRSRKLILLILALLIILAVIGYGFWYFNKKVNDLTKEKEKIQNELSNLKSSNDSSPSPTSKAKTTTNDSQLNSSTIQNSDATCGLSVQDKSEMNGWKTFDNKTFGFTYQYDNGFNLIDQEQSDNNSTFFSEYGSAYISILIGQAASRTPVDSALNLIAEKNGKIGCLDANIKTYNLKDENLIRVSFDRNDYPYLITLSYKTVNNSASLSSPITNGFDRTLKSFSFK